MNELKDYRIPTRSGNVCHCYLKSETDKVIAEKDKEIAEQNNDIEKLIEQVREYAQYLYVIQARAEKEARHDKYKRCLDNAWQCKKLSYVYTVNACNHRGWNIERYYDKKTELYRKWHKRWLELAGQFKEVK